MNVEDIKQLMDGFDPAALLPDLTTVAGKMELVCRIAVLIGPILLLVLGLIYLFLAPKEANHRFGFRCYYGMGSVEAWRFTQKLAGLLWSGLGLILSIVMLLSTLGFRNLTIVDQIWRSVKCLCWEAGLTLAVVVFIHVMAGLTFDKDGCRRPNAPKFELNFKFKK
jgi:hypothetical protein